MYDRVTKYWYGNRDTDGEKNVAYTKLPHFRHTPLPLLLAVLRIFNPEGPFHIARCFSASFMQALSPKRLHRDWPCIIWKENLLMTMRNFYSHLKAVSSCQGETKWQTGRGQSFSLHLPFLNEIFYNVFGSKKGEENRLHFFLSHDSRKGWIVLICNFSKGSASGREQNWKSQDQRKPALSLKSPAMSNTKINNTSQHC